MEKRALAAIALSVAVLVTWQMLFAPASPPAPPAPISAPAPASPPAAGQPPAESGAAGSAAAGSPSPAAGATASSPAAEPIQAGAKEEFRLITQTQDVRLSNEGGKVTWWRLKKYTVDGGIPVDIIPEAAREAGVLPLQIEIPDQPELTRTLATSLHVHEMEEIPEGDPSGLGPGRRVTFRYADGRGLSVTKTLELPEDGYLGRVSFQVTRDGAPLVASLIWASGLSEQAEDQTQRYGHVEGQAIFHDGREVSRRPAAGVEAPALYAASNGTPLLWGGLESTYFAALMLAPDGGAELAMALTPRHPPSPAGGAKTAAATLLTVGARASGGGVYRLFVGPKDYALLQSVGHDLVKAIHFSDYSIIYVCTKALFLAMIWINQYVGNFGWSIILLTIAVRLAFFPIMYRSSITMRQTSKKMAKVQPKVKSIQERYRKQKKTMETQRQMNEEIMALYKREGVNPMANLGGCLPLLLQMPIFIGFYNMLSVAIEMRQAPFVFWIQDLSRRDPLTIPVLPLLMGASWLVQQWMTSSSIPDPMQRRMMMLMPIMFTFFMMSMPSGLVLYWLTSNLLGMAQQWITNRKADQLDEAAKRQGHGHGDSPAKARRAEDGQTA